MPFVSMIRDPGRGSTQRGFTYIGLLLALAILAAGLSEAGVVWHTETQRAKEAELLFIGAEFKRAISGFYDATPGPVKQLPKRLEDLLRDTRYPTVRRHLRKIYVDPLTGKSEWGLVATPAGITGVYSLSGREPFRRRATQSFPSGPSAPAMGSASPALSTASGARRASKYSDWKFVAEFEQAPAPAVAEPGAPGPVPQPGRDVQPVGGTEPFIPQTSQPRPLMDSLVK
jgi:type II secretory pathway pseudopilin PulG